MKLIEIGLGQSIWLLDMVRPSGPPPLVEVIDKIVKRYRFSIFPSTVGELTSDEKIFRIGRFRDIAIDRLAVYGDGVVVDTRAPIEDADSFLQDALDYMSEEYAFEIAEYPPVRKLYNSTLTVKLDFDISRKLQFLSSVAERLSEWVTESSSIDHSYGPSGFYLQADTSNMRHGAAGSFRIERKINAPFDSNVFVTTAPISTTRHIALLEEIEASG